MFRAVNFFTRSRLQRASAGGFYPPFILPTDSVKRFGSRTVWVAQ
jgi:hypothetical protein